MGHGVGQASKNTGAFKMTDIPVVRRIDGFNVTDCAYWSGVSNIHGSMAVKVDKSGHEQIATAIDDDAAMVAWKDMYGNA